MSVNIRHNITAPPLRGCVDYLTANYEIVKFDVAIGVSDGCPVSLLVNRHEQMTRRHGCFESLAY